MENKVLALYSKSPRRLELLKNVGLFDVVVAPSNFKELKRPGEQVRDYVLRNASGKLAESHFEASDCVEKLAELAADTVVYYQGDVLEKPKNLEHAKEMLRSMSGSTHEVLTGVALKFQELSSSRENAVKDRFIVETKVKLGRIDEASLSRYLDSMDWQDKAGGYGIQGFIGSFVVSISGSYQNVVGLPVAQVLESMRKNDFI